MCILKRLLAIYRKWWTKKNKSCDCLISSLQLAIFDAEELFADKDKVITADRLANWEAVHGSLVYQTAEAKIKTLWIARHYKQLQSLIPVYQETSENLHQRAIEHNKQREFSIVLKEIMSAVNDAGLVLKNQTGFVDPAKYHEWKQTHRDALALDRTALYLLSTAYNHMELEAKWYELIRIERMLLTDIQRHNENVASKMVNYAYEKTGLVEGQRMDGQQMQCVAMDVRNHLVIAGAGTGKTTTIIARIKYLLATGQCGPRDILVLSFTRASADEMRERIKKETGGKRIDVFTFHQLGLRIISHCEKDRPNTCSQSILTEIVKENIASSRLDEYLEITGQERNFVIRLLSTLVAQMKSKGYSLDDFRKKIQDSVADRKYNMYIFELLVPIFQAYQAFLAETNTMDFNDMLWRAIGLIRERQYLHPYKYVIVDEYQDISHAPDVLLHEMRRSNDYRLFCVGDDWQSIYRFNGGDIDYILNFEKYWGPAQISKIETTYRFSQQLVDVSSKFIMKNPHQYKKAMVGKSPEGEGFALGIIRNNLYPDAIEAMITKFSELPMGSTVFILGRYNRDKDILKRFTDLYVSDNAGGDASIEYQRRPDLKISFLTAHKSKGLQADYVFIINNRQGRMGFPSQYQDPPILRLLMNSGETYPFAEERRLFYVALTRARKKVYLVIQNDNISDFAKELICDYSEEIASETLETTEA